MEFNYQEESINSSEEAYQENNDLGVGRLYECVFCKRGFNTAQALGGHMNIHRKDRARNKPTSSNSTRQEQIHPGPRLYKQIPSPAPAPAPAYTNDQSASHRFASRLSYATYTPASASHARSLYGNCDYNRRRSSSDDSDRDHQQPSNSLVPVLSLEFSPTIMEDLGKDREEMNQKQELDLELRLGYDS